MCSLLALNLLQLTLVFHVIGITIMAGTTLVSYYAFGKFWKQYKRDKQQSIPIMATISGFSVLIGIGIGLLILTGLTMMALTRGVFAQQLWFQIKIVLVVLIIVNALAIARPQTLKLQRLIGAEINGTNSQAKIALLKRRISLFYVIQLLLFVTIFVLSIFRFN